MFVLAAASLAAPDARIAAARELAGADPRAAVAELRALRPSLGPADRLAADEVTCRVLTDLDANEAVAVADAGLRDPVPPEGRVAALRLRACRAGMLVETGDVAGGAAALEEVLTEAADLPAVRALALVERGVWRSRHGELTAGQADLLEACAAFADGPRADRELCLSHLAGHYRRIGDVDEALRLLSGLRDSARARGAAYDDSVYTFAVARSLQQLERWDEAVAAFGEVAAVSGALDDPLGVSYAESGVADCLLRAGRPVDALVHAERSLALLDAEADPSQHERAVVSLAEALVGVGRAADADAALEGVGRAVHERGDRPTLARWLWVRAQCRRALGDPRAAYEALVQAREIERALDAQRLSDQSARLRMQFNRERDAKELAWLRELNAQGQQLRRTQVLAVALFALLVGALGLAGVRQLRRAQKVAATDELTGLSNRRDVLAHLAAAAQGSGPLSVLMVDVDHFKRINDTYGHATGDDVLRHLAHVLSANLREGDRLGRLGGEEFVAVLPDADLEAAAQIGERLRAAVANTPLLRHPEPLAFTVSVGAAERAADEAPEAALARADAALYRAKGAGRNVVVRSEPSAARSERATAS